MAEAVPEAHEPMDVDGEPSADATPASRADTSDAASTSSAREGSSLPAVPSRGTRSAQKGITVKSGSSSIFLSRPPNSTSTIFLSSTIDVPNTDEIAIGVGTVLYCQILQDIQGGCRCPRVYLSAFRLFDQNLYKGEDAPMTDPYTCPSVTDIASYLKQVFEIAQFSPECYVISLVYINRIIASCKVPLCGSTWRLKVLSALLLAQKVWDDRSLANVDFPVIWRNVITHDEGGTMDLKAINRMERKFLELLQYTVTVPSSLYAKYFFELRTLARDNNMSFRLQPLTPEEAERLEAQSAMRQDYFKHRRTARRSAGGPLDTPGSVSSHVSAASAATGGGGGGGMERRALTYEDVTRSKTSRAVIS